jgi:putative ABC transport system permease protein
MSYTVRTRENPVSIVDAVRREAASIARAVPVARVRVMSDIVASATSRERFNVAVLGTFAVAALLLAALGLYGVMAYVVTHRVREIGIRMALGGRPGEVTRLVLLEGLQVTGTGILVGLLLSFVLTRLLRGILVGVGPGDPATYAGVAVLLGMVGLVATYIPARRATRVNPVEALRA